MIQFGWVCAIPPWQMVHVTPLSPREPVLPDGGADVLLDTKVWEVIINIIQINSAVSIRFIFLKIIIANL